MKKRILSMTLAVAMLLGTLVGCGAKEETVTKGDNTLVIGLPQVATVTDYEDNYFTNYLEEKTGVDIEFRFFSSTGSEARQQLTLLCNTTEKLPDVLLGFTSISHYQMNQFGEDGFIIDLTDLIDEYAVNYKEQLAKLPKEKQAYLKEKGTNTITGEFYAMPRVMPQTMDNRQNWTYINKAWLDTLGLQVPTTIAELETVLQAFATKDPNGNGLADELPMLTTITSHIINAYVCYESGAFNVTDGKVWDAVTTDEFRQGLIKGNELVSKGLWSELSFTVTTTDLKKLISPVNGVCKVGIFSGNHSSNTNPESDVLKDFVALPDFADETGKGGYSVIVEPSVDWLGYISKDCENPELAMKFLDAFYADEAVTIQRHGIKDEEWVYEEGKNVYGTTSYCKPLVQSISGTSSWHRNMLGICTYWNYINVKSDSESSRLHEEQWNVMQAGKQREEVVGDLIYTEEEYDVREAKASIIQSYIVEQIALFMTGEKNPKSDADWNAFLKDLETYGRSELLKIAQDAYDRKTK